MEETNLSKKVSSSFFWKIMENGGSQGVQFIVSIVLARLLSPREYGLIALATIFINIANVLVQNGFATALIQRKEERIRDYSSILFLNLIVAAVLYFALYIFSPDIAKFYKNDDIIRVFRSLGIVMLPGGVISVQNAYISRQMKFKSLFIATFFSSILSGTISIFLAYKNFGVFALVWQQIIYYFSLMILLFVFSEFRPKLSFEIDRIKILFSFGSKILLASLIDTAFENLNGLVLGKVYNEETLGAYNRGEQFPKLIVMNLGNAIQSVMLPLMSKVQDDRKKVRDLLKNSIKLSSYIILPMMAGMLALADTIIIVLLGEKWSVAIPFLRLLSISYACWPIHIANLQAMNALGRSDKFLRLEIIKKFVGILALFIGAYFSATMVLIMKVLADLIGIFINAYPNKELLNYSASMQIKDIKSSIFLSAIMGLSIFFVGNFFGASLLKLVSLIILGIIIYILLSIISKNDNFYFLLNNFVVLKRKIN